MHMKSLETQYKRMVGSQGLAKFIISSKIEFQKFIKNLFGSAFKFTNQQVLIQFELPLDLPEYDLHGMKPHTPQFTRCIINIPNPKGVFTQKTNLCGICFLT